MRESPRVGTLVTAELLAALDEVFPQTLPSINDSERKIFTVVGHRQVVDWLRAQYEERAEEALGD